MAEPHPSPAGLPAQLLVAVAVVAAVAATLGIPARATFGAQVSADEPYYLLSATSLAHDGDLDLTDELARRVYEPYHRIELDPQARPASVRGTQISPHDPLLPVVLALPMALGGWVAAKATLAVLAGVTAALTLWVAVRRFGVDSARGAVVVGALFAAIPLAPYGSQVYPELPAALAVTGAVAVLTARPFTGRAATAAMVAVVALPWLSVKYVPVTAVLAAALLRRRRAAGTSITAVLGVLGVLTVAAVVYAGVHQRIYGGWTVYAAGDHFAETGEASVVGTEVDLVGRARRLTGLLLDRSFGLAAWAPAWFALPPAVAAFARRRSPDATLLLAVLAAGWLTATFVALTMHGWWVPGRQLVVVAPLAVIVLARELTRWGAGRARIVGAAALAALAALAAGVLNWAWLAIEASTGRRTLIVDFVTTTAPPYRLLRSLLPDGMRASGVDDLVLVAWSVVLVAGMVLAWRHAGRDDGRAPRPGAPAVDELLGPVSRPGGRSGSTVRR